MNSKSDQSGMTLIEIMVALLLGAFLLGGILTSFTGSKQTNRMLEELSRLQENGRYALDLLANDIRMSRFIGCQSLNNITPNIVVGVPPLPVVNFLNAFSGSDNVSNTWNARACSGAGECIANTDAINLMFGESCGGNLVGAMVNPTDNIQISANSCSFSANAAMLISNCTAADIFRATNAAPPVQHPALNALYGTNAEVFRFRAYTYFIRESTSGAGSSLWRLDVTSAADPVEMVEGIENMQIWYGEDTDATPDGMANYYISANQVINMARVVSVRVSLLLRSLEEVASQPVRYVYNGDTQIENDRFLRRVFTTTIALRNHP
jgi:type IV pilus assembly protein PilW